MSRRRDRPRAYARLILVLAVGVLAGAPAAGAREPKPLAPSVMPLTDGIATTVLWDSAQRTARIVSDASPLTGGETVSAPAGCEASAVGAGQVLFGCIDPEGADIGARAPLVYRLASRDWHIPAGTPVLLDDQRASSGGVFRYTGIGSALATLTTKTSKSDNVRLIDLATGKAMYPTEAPRMVPTMDVPSGRAPLCRPVRRRARTAEHPYVSDVRQRQNAVQFGRWTLRWWDRLGLTVSRALTLQRCGSHTATPLARRGFRSPILTSRYVAWIAGRTLHVRTPRSGRTRSFRLPRQHPGGLRFYDLAGTQKRIFVLPNDGRSPARVVDP